MSNISVFANFYINDQERFLRLQDSFLSFFKSDIDRWYINVRGNKKKLVINFLKKNLPSNKLYLSSIETKNGWMKDSYLIAKNIESNYIFFWVEDHICKSGYRYLNNIFNSIYKNKIDYLPYSWFFFGNNIKSLEFTKLNNDKNIYYTNYNIHLHKKRIKFAKQNKIIADIYITSCCSILKKNIFLSILSSRDLFFRKWDKSLPFNFEKTQFDFHWLPYKIGIPKKEVFVSIDDDLGCNNYSLISRKLYPLRKSTVKNKKTDVNRINSKYNYWINFKIKLKCICNFFSILLFLITKKWKHQF
jgi:hypothetical protein